MATNYGTATLGVTDVPLKSISSSSAYLVVGQRVMRRLLTPRGGLASIGGDPNFGWDIRQYTNGRVSSAALAQAQQEIQRECLKDEEVLGASVTFAYAFNASLVITIQLTGATGPFSLVLPVQNLTAAQIYAT